MLSGHEGTTCSLCTNRGDGGVHRTRLGLLYHLSLFHNQVEGLVPPNHRIVQPHAKRSQHKKILKTNNKELLKVQEPSPILKSPLKSPLKKAGLDIYRCHLPGCTFVPRLPSRQQMYAHYGLEHYRRAVLEELLEASWAVLGASGGTLGPSWDILRPS